MMTDYYQQRYPFILHRCRWKFNLAPTVKNSLFTLEPLNEGHIDSIVLMVSNPQFSGFYDEVRTYRFKLRAALKSLVKRGGHFAIRLNEGNAIIGELVVLEEEKGKWEISYWLDCNLWGRGLMTDVVKGFSSWFFDNTALDSIYARTLLTNLPSRRVLEKAGFVREKEVGNYVMLRLDRENRKDEVR